LCPWVNVHPIFQAHFSILKFFCRNFIRHAHSYNNFVAKVCWMEWSSTPYKTETNATLVLNHKHVDTFFHKDAFLFRRMKKHKRCISAKCIQFVKCQTCYIYANNVKHCVLWYFSSLTSINYVYTLYMVHVLINQCLIEWIDKVK
jgi:hypothetical protein